MLMPRAMGLLEHGYCVLCMPLHAGLIGRLEDKGPAAPTMESNNGTSHT